ncbi:M64 family metallopeptidase [Actinokineospora xionganensis]|uniref:IgA Peptidase M64 n=1 Tax=Actinokineospora xionganensis TaxID=2684470 RepID=A0ABR7L3Q6_9PSEU|nr:M64 family metallopeptidase [Actinokineospora xionganensis]MBC6447310.1 hypothetical protein [Actinokineospora xionganensis]
MRRKSILLALLATAMMAVSLPDIRQASAAPDEETRTDVLEVFSPDGTISRRPVTRPAIELPARAQAVAAAEVIPIEINGPSASRFDLVFVGDGYTSAQLGTYGEHVRGKLAEIMAVEPFKSYRGQFNVWQVNVISPESGVDNDPSYGIRRNTALDMYFWCGNIERLLCVNETKARQYASSAEDVDQVIALANTTKYGGAGGNVATSSGGNALAGQIVVHELGHSIGGLADEYTYGGGDCYPYREPREINSSRYTAEQMRQYQAKWYRWLGQVSPDGGVVDTYTGSSYYTRCVYRPTDNSLMRSLGRAFNLPGREAMIAALYKETGVVEAAASDESESPWVLPLGGASVTWTLDGQPAGTGTHFAAPALSPGAHEVVATVTDSTSAVLDPELRKRYMTRRISWIIGE